MSLELAKLRNSDSREKLTREQIIGLREPLDYGDGRTKQSFKDETDIQKIMARADRAGTISHLEKFEGVYADYADFDFHEQTQKLTQGREIFDQLPAELRKEFGQSPAAFFSYVNDPANKDELMKKLPPLAEPGQQMLSTKPADADTDAAAAAADKVVAPTATPTPAEPAAAAPAATIAPPASSPG